MTTEEPYSTWIEGETVARAPAAHAVAVTDGKAATVTLCGERVGGSVEGAFASTRSQVRCPHCASVLGPAQT